MIKAVFKYYTKHGLKTIVAVGINHSDAENAVVNKAKSIGYKDPEWWQFWLSPGELTFVDYDPNSESIWND